MAYPYKKMTSQDCDYIRSVTAPDRVWVGEEIASEYYRDEMPEYGVYQPDLYVEVVNKEEVSAIMAYAYKENIPVVCRGAGTGLAGGATCKYGGIMLSIMRMNKIFPIDRKNQTITAQPGALLIDIQAAAAAGGLFYPPDPGEKTASIGGNVITNAGGMKAVRYGLTRDFVRCIEAVMPDGSIMNFSSNVVKNTTGYDVKDLIIGSEGTLCILTEVTLKLLPAPTCTCTLVMPFKSLEECADMVPKVLELPFVPTAIEFLERELIDIVERNLNKMFPVKEGEAVLIVMYDASSKQELDSAVEAAAEAALANGALDCAIAGTPERAGAVWSVRGGILEGMKADSVAQEECDVVVPRARIAEYVKAAKKIASAHGIRVEPCGHCGDGNIHTEMLRGPEMSDEEWKAATHASLTELYALSKELGGQLSGEHGIGNGRLEFLEEFVGPRMIQLYKSIKLAFSGADSHIEDAECLRKCFFCADCCRKSCSGRSYQFSFHLCHPEFQTAVLDNIGNCRNRNRKDAMLAAHGSLSLTKKRNDYTIHLQTVHTDRSCNNIHDRIHGSHLMKMHLIFRYIVCLRLRFRQNPENIFCQFFRRIRHITPVNDRENISKSAMFVMMMVMLLMSSFFLRMHHFRLQEKPTPSASLPPTFKKGSRNWELPVNTSQPSMKSKTTFWKTASPVTS